MPRVNTVSLKCCTLCSILLKLFFKIDERHSDTVTRKENCNQKTSLESESILSASTAQKAHFGILSRKPNITTSHLYFVSPSGRALQCTFNPLWKTPLFRRPPTSTKSALSVLSCSEMFCKQLFSVVTFENINESGGTGRKNINFSHAQVVAKKKVPQLNLKQHVRHKHFNIPFLVISCWLYSVEKGTQNGN